MIALLRRVFIACIEPAAPFAATVLLCGSGCSEKFLPASLVVNERVVAVTATPPEAVPGQTVSLEPLVVSGAGELVVDEGYRASWWRCPDSDSDALGDYVQCSVPSERREVGTGVPYEDSVPAALFGTLPPPGSTQEPADPEAVPLPNDKLLGALLGYWRVVGLTVTSGERTVDAFKRIPVYLPVRLGEVDARLASLDTRIDQNGRDVGANTNPTMTAVLVHENEVTGPTTTKVKAGQTFFFEPVYDADVLQEYLSLKVDLEGLDLSDPESVRDEPVSELLARFQKVQRCEVPTFSWFVTHGRLRRDTTLDESVLEKIYDARGIDCPPVEGEERVPQVEYTAPTGEDDDPLPEDGIIRGWVVMRDGRGGTATRSFELTLE